MKLEQSALRSEMGVRPSRVPVTWRAQLLPWHSRFSRVPAMTAATKERTTAAFILNYRTGYVLVREVWLGLSWLGREAGLRLRRTGRKGTKGNEGWLYGGNKAVLIQRCVQEYGRRGGGADFIHHVCRWLYSVHWYLTPRQHLLSTVHSLLRTGYNGRGRGLRSEQ